MEHKRARKSTPSRGILLIFVARARLIGDLTRRLIDRQTDLRQTARQIGDDDDIDDDGDDDDGIK